MIQLKFGQVEAILAEIYHIAADKRVAFAGRLKQLQKSGVPDRQRPGRGKAGTYSWEDVLQLTAGTEFLRCGMGPTMAAAHVLGNWGRMSAIMHLSQANAEAIAELDTPGSEPKERFPYWWVVDPGGLDDVQRGPRERFNIRYYEGRNIDWLITSWMGRKGATPFPRRGTIINATALARTLANVAAEIFEFVSHEHIRAANDKELEIWAEEAVPLAPTPEWDGSEKTENDAIVSLKAWTEVLRSAAFDAPLPPAGPQAIERAKLLTKGLRQFVTTLAKAEPNTCIINQEHLRELMDLHIVIATDNEAEWSLTAWGRKVLAAVLAMDWSEHVDSEA